MAKSSSSSEAIYRRPYPLGRAIGVALGAWTVVLLLGMLPFRQNLELREYDILNAMFPAPVTNSPVVIVGIDESSFEVLDTQWPWPRGLHADLIDALYGAGAAVVALDVLFAEPSDPAQDQRLADAIAKAGNVVLAADIAVQETEYYSQMMRVEPAPLFRRAGGYSGIVTVGIDTDLVVRGIPSYGDDFWYVTLGNYVASTGFDFAHEAPAPGDMIRYLAPGSPGIRRVSYYQALNPGEFLPTDIFKDKIVLVGLDVKASPDPQAPLTDTFATPFSGFTGSLTPGVQIHANVIINAIAGLAVTPAPALLSPGLAVFLALIMAFATGRWTPLKGGLWMIGGLLGLAGLAAVAYDRHGYWIPIMIPALAVVLVFIGHGAIAFLVERHRRLEIKGMFGRYLSPALVNEITAHPERLQLGGVERELTLMFTDIAGFTSLSERLPAAQVSEILNDYLTRMTRIIMDHGGTVDKFIGDAIMAFWGAPLEDRDHAQHAVAAGLEMRRAMAAMNVEFQQRGWPPVMTRMGLHTGIAVVGNMGSEDRFDYTAIGDTVNLASRLEGINKLYGTDLAFSAATAGQLDDTVSLRLLDRVRVKGKSEFVDVFTVTDDPALAGRVMAAFDAYRRAEWALARSLWRDILDRYPDDRPAGIFLARIDEMDGVVDPDHWDGSVALEKM